MGAFDDLIPGGAKSFDDLVPQRSPSVRTARMIGQGAQGFNDAIANTVGAPVDLIAAGLRAVGGDPNPTPFMTPSAPPIGGSESIKNFFDYTATFPGRVADLPAQGINALSDGRTSRFAPETRGEKIANKVGEVVGGTASVVMPAGRIAAAALPGSMRAGVATALASQPRLQYGAGAAGGATEGATDNPLLGLAVNAAIPIATAGGSRILRPVNDSLRPAERTIVNNARREGIDLTPGQATGSDALLNTEGNFGRLPGAAGPQRVAYENQRDQFTRAVMERVGGAADASPETLNRLRGVIGQRFDDLIQRTTLTGDNAFVTAVEDTANRYGRRLDNNVARTFTAYYDDLQPFMEAVRRGQNPQFDGQVYRNIRTDLGKSIQGAQGDLRTALRGLAESMDDMVERSMGTNLRGEWQDARRQWSALLTIDDAMAKAPQAERASGQIPLGSFSGAVKASDREGYARARGQFGELAKIGDYLAPKIRDSGTPQGNAFYNSLVAPVVAGGGVTAATGDPMLGMISGAATAAGAAAPWAASRAYNTGPVQNWLTNTMPAGARPSARNALSGMTTREAIDAVPEEDAAQRARRLRAANERGGR